VTSRPRSFQLTGLNGDERAPAAVDDGIAATEDAITQLHTLSCLLHPPMIERA